MSLLEIKKQYNILIAREKAAETYLENNSIAQATRDKWLPAFNELTIKLSFLMRDFRELTGKEMDTNNVLNGFENGI